MTNSPSANDLQVRRRQIGEAIRGHRFFLIVGHTRPDGDCLGSQIALGLGLRAMGKTVRIWTAGPILPSLRFLPGLDQIESEIDPAFEPEVTIYCDCGGLTRPGGDFEPRGLVLNIDHHISNDHFGDINWVDTGAAAVGEMIFDLLNDLGVPFSPDIANCLYLAVMADSGSFKYGNTTLRTFEVATECVRRGANPAWVGEEFYDSLSRDTLLIKGQVLSHLHFEFGGRLCWSEISQELYERGGGEINEPEGLVGEMRSIEGVEVSVLIHELAEGGARAGLRSRGTHRVDRIAERLGGGGHPSAAGCYILGDFAEVRERILREVRAEMMPAVTSQRPAAG
ncbi:bifunctional oligoribonuclease/PAP phosphatase NrnA [Candidatus Sumerlaeota bacterium]|nr:bifunctional oligoribonuclease/PAP phosphatase NrnA [Candidatus Sumerlaeota bacterium]